MLFKLIHENRVKVPCTNTRVFGHAGNAKQVHNEVYDWLDQVAGPLPSGGGTRWVERTYRNGPVMPAATRGSPMSTSARRPFSPSFNAGSIDGVYFYFATMELAIMFKLAWGGEA